MTDYIIAQDDAHTSYINPKLKLKFEGRFGIVRVEEREGVKTISLYIGEGKKLSFGKETINADAYNKGFKSINVKGKKS